MAKRQWTPEERKAFGEKMRALKAAKKKELAEGTATPDIVETPPSQNTQAEPPKGESYSGGGDIDDLRRQVQELKDMLFFQNRQQPGAQVTQRGIVGTVTKYSINPRDYPNPSDQLFEEPRLKLKGFNRDWWDLEWTVGKVNYETKDGVSTVEPKFQVKLIRIVEDPETGEPSNKRYVLWKGTFFEDPQAAIQVALDNGIEVSDEIQKEFLDAMRYLRIRDWLLEAFYPPKPSQSKMNKVETVIGNRLVEVYEVNSANSETIPFNQLTKKL